jgi:hypothetical protein
MQQTSEVKSATLVWWAKEDINWISQEASHRRLKRAHLIRMAVLDWLRKNAQTKEPK